VVKILTTAMGEATSDYMVKIFGPVPAVLMGTAAFGVALVLQLRMGRYLAWTYWFAVSMVAVFGTQAADVLHVKFGVPYVASATFYGVVLILVFSAWAKAEASLSIHSITSLRRELFYWAAVLATFALGTAVGDMTATTFHWGYLRSGVIFAALFVLPGLAYRVHLLGSVGAFWIAYVLTRPLGASFADYMSRTRNQGGMDWGAPVPLLLAAAILVLVAYLAAAQPDTEGRGAPGSADREGRSRLSRRSLT
jgi:uncharacterized membrane-anchored protein